MTGTRKKVQAIARTFRDNAIITNATIQYRKLKTTCDEHLNNFLIT